MPDETPEDKAKNRSFAYEFCNQAGLPDERAILSALEKAACDSGVIASELFDSIRKNLSCIGALLTCQKCSLL